MRVAVAHGVSQLLVTYSLKTGSAAAAKKAIQLSPKDADAHVASAGMLSLAHAPEQSLVELEQAIALRPTDYRLWSELGLVRDQVGDTAGALLAFDEAIARAPHYSQPRWNRGNVLLRSKEYEAGFKDLSQAAQSNPELIPGLLDLAWGLSRGDVALTEQLVGLRGDKMRIAFAELLVRQGRAQEAVAQFVQATDVSDGVKTELIDMLSARGASNKRSIFGKPRMDFELKRSKQDLLLTTEVSKDRCRLVNVVSDGECRATCRRLQYRSTPAGLMMDRRA